ncbi:hypothetical protein GP486_004395 [Trichoglossum hirsutum]|uniref:Uncharacterized protein n=1 Tax=Trichoglossum hirsutum TaxID=265104 RepID=A0A9P8LB54_9PEZI|nr:hypothetical protein GP486_004395 [Trichoglossum hirsutum]
MDCGPYYIYPGQFNRRGQRQSNPAYGMPHSSNFPEESTFGEHFHPQSAPLDMNSIQHTAISEQDYGAIPPGFVTNFTSSQPSSYMAAVDVGDDNPNLAWTTSPNGIPEVYGPTPASIAATGYDFGQGVIGDAATIQTLSTTLPMQYDDQLLSTHLPATFELTSNGHMEPPELAPQNGFGPLPTGEVGGGSSDDILPYVLPCVSPTPSFGIPLLLWH